MRYFLSNLLAAGLLMANAPLWAQIPEGKNFFEIQRKFYETHGKPEYHRAEREHEDFNHDSDRDAARMPQQEDEEREFTDDEFAKFARWEWFWQQRVSPTGEFPPRDILWKESNRYAQTHAAFKQQQTTTLPAWKPLGPTTTPGGYDGLGRLNCIGFHPTNPNIFWVGAAAGGVWKTTDGGMTWNTYTDKLPLLGVSDIAVHPQNPDIQYVATGDGNGSDTYSIGVLKSTDGGLTYQTTGLTWQAADGNIIRRLLLHPTNTNILLAGANNGIRRSADGGATWQIVSNIPCRDLEWHPTNPDIVYGGMYPSDGQIYRSTDAGITWTKVSAFWGANRINIAVSAANPKYVMAVAANFSNGLRAVFTSSDEGLSWDSTYNGDCITKNLLGYEADGSTCTGQGWYDLAIAMNPNNANEAYVGGINTWKTTNFGSSWALNSFWYQDNSLGVATVHADKHWLAFQPITGAVFVCNDGGLYRSEDSGFSWDDLSNGMQISQFYRIATSSTPQHIAGGLQDNGSRELINGTWESLSGGDGMNVEIDFNNPQIRYPSYVYGEIYRTDNLLQTYETISDNIPQKPQGAWLTPFILDPNQQNIIYAGYQAVYRSMDRGDTWVNRGNLQLIASGNIQHLAISPVLSNVMYAAMSYELYWSLDSGNTWMPISLSAIGTPGAITRVVADVIDPYRLYVTFGGYTAGKKIYTTNDGGQTWENISGSLPNLPATCLALDANNHGIMYVGTEVGVFYRDSTLSDWIPLQDSLPNVIISDLEVSQVDLRLYAGTYGRGIWYAPLVQLNVSSKENTPIQRMLVYPNPTTDRTDVHISGFVGASSLLLSDMAGRELLRQPISETHASLSLGAFPVGVYTLRLLAPTGETIGYEKIVRINE